MKKTGHFFMSESQKEKKTKFGSLDHIFCVLNVFWVGHFTIVLTAHS